MGRSSRHKGTDWPALLAIVVILPLLLMLLPLILMIIPVLVTLGAVHGYALKRRFQRRWAPEGRFVLFVHSDSPVWSEYLQKNLFPRIQHQTVFLNWSRRSEWKKKRPLEARMLDHWGGDYDFNPMAIIVPPSGRIRTVRFYRAFRDFKHGNEATLCEAEESLFQHIADLLRQR